MKFCAKACVVSSGVTVTVAEALLALDEEIEDADELDELETLELDDELDDEIEDEGTPELPLLDPPPPPQPHSSGSTSEMMLTSSNFFIGVLFFCNQQQPALSHLCLFAKIALCVEYGCYKNFHPSCACCEHEGCQVAATQA